MSEKKSHAKGNGRADDESVGMTNLPKKTIPRLQVRNGAPTPPEALEPILIGLMSLSQNCAQINDEKLKADLSPKLCYSRMCKNKRPEQQITYLSIPGIAFEVQFDSVITHKQSAFLDFDKWLLEIHLPTLIALQEEQ